jgi:hypothetical protein
MIFNRYISLLTRYIIKELLIKNNILFEDWTPYPASLLWQGALRSSRSNIIFLGA